VDSFSTGAIPATIRPVRPRELQDPLNLYLYHPLAWRLARRLATTPVTPNMVSLFGALLVIAAGIAYTRLAWPLAAALGMALHMIWHVVDGADGDLARLTGRSGPHGELVDGLCDYLSHVALYLLLGTMLAGEGHALGGWRSWVLVVFAGISHAVQANHVEVQRRQYQWWVYGTPWLRNSSGLASSGAGRGWAGVLVSGYLRLASGMTPEALRIDAAVQAGQNSAARLELIATAVRAEAPRLLLLCKILGPNPRAVILGLSMFCGTPAWYLFYQSLVLNALLVFSVAFHNAAARRIVARIET